MPRPATFTEDQTLCAALRRVVFALVDVPYAVGRRYLIKGELPPPLADEFVTETLRCVLL